tara:strand:- start:56 stop:613 length:558 start_codon:yes stop_codon:yes gene_type:complete
MEANWAGDDDDEPPDVILDGEGRVYGSGAACDCSTAVFDDLLRVRGPTLRALTAECQLAAWPLASGSFWLGADEKPRCALERLAAAIFKLHTAGRPFDRASSGAEWWANVSRSETIGRGAASAYGDIGMHFDKDEDAYARCGLLLHPLLSTITYLCDGGVCHLSALELRTRPAAPERPALDPSFL